MGQVVRENEQRFHQRDHEHRDHHEWNPATEFSLRAGRVQQRGEGRDRRENRKDDGGADAARAADGGREPPVSPRSLREDALSNDDRVVHDDAQRKNERHQREHVDRDAQEPHHEERAHERDRQTHGHPHGESNLQEERQRREDEREPDQGVLRHEAETAADFLRIILPQFHRDAFGQGRHHFDVEIPLDGFGDVQHLLVGGPVHVDPDRRLPVVADAQIGVGEAVPHRRDLAEPHRRAVQTAEEDDLLEIHLLVVLPQRANEDVLATGGYPAGGQFERTLPHRERDVVQSQTEGAQAPQGHLDRDLVRTGTADLGQRHLGKGGESFLDAVGQFLERALRHIAVHEKTNDALPTRDLAYLGPFRSGREGRNAVDLGLHFVEGAVDVRPRSELRNHGREPLGRGGFHSAQAVHRPDLLLDPADDGFLDLLGSRAGIGDKDLDAVQGKIGQDFLDQVPGRGQAREDEKQHDHVCGDAVLRHEADGAPDTASVEVTVVTHTALFRDVSHLPSADARRPDGRHSQA